jgi:hypothetical protein
MGRRERSIVAVLTAVVAAIVIVTVVAITVSGSGPKKGCLNATVPGPIGATFFHQCGSAARQVCGNLQTSNDLNKFGAALVTKDCRRAGYPVG